MKTLTPCVLRRSAVSLALIVAALCVVPSAFAQNPPFDGQRVQESKTHLDAATQFGTSATSAATVTLTPNGGEYVYLSTITVTNCAGSAAVTAAAVTSLTTTNLSGSPAWTIGSGVAAGLCQPVLTEIFPNGFRAQTPGSAVTFVLPTFATNQTLRVNVSWFSAP